jgi:hypothetical protein
MMNSNLRLLIMGGMLAVATTSCKKSFYDINENPNTITEQSVTSDLIIPAALHAAGAGDASGNSAGYDWLNKWMGYWSSPSDFAPTQEEISYNITTTFLNNRWNIIYNNLNDFTIARDKAIAEGKDFYAGIAKVFRAKYFQDLVDMYGNVPYSQAFNLKEFPNPKYDKGQDIYNALQVELDEAITIFTTKPVPVGGAAVDIVYGGNLPLWTRFANTLKLRLLIRQSEVPGFNPAGEIAKIIAKGGVLQSGETADVNPGYTNAVNKQSPFYATNGFTPTGAAANTGDRANSFFINLLKGNSDPRLQRYFAPATSPANAADPYQGSVYGETGSNPNTTSARLSGFGPGLIANATQSQWILTSVESLFLYAEAVARGWIAGNAQTAYENAVRESFIWLGVPNAVTAANTYMTNNPTANWANSGATTLDKVRFIVSQKYIAMAGFAPLEAWTDYRRLGVPANVPLSVFAGRGPNIPVRLLYPLTEYAVNKENVQAEGSLSPFTSKVFWDVN